MATELEKNTLPDLAFVSRLDNYTGEVIGSTLEKEVEKHNKQEVTSHRAAHIYLMSVLWWNPYMMC